MSTQLGRLPQTPKISQAMGDIGCEASPASMTSWFRKSANYLPASTRVKDLTNLALPIATGTGDWSTKEQMLLIPKGTPNNWKNSRPVRLSSVLPSEYWIYQRISTPLTSITWVYVRFQSQSGHLALCSPCATCGPNSKISTSAAFSTAFRRRAPWEPRDSDLIAPLVVALGQGGRPEYILTTHEYIE